MGPAELNLFASRMRALCDEMGVFLRQSAVSTNIKDRLDYSCAIFDRHGCLIAQAEHIPVHLGSMAYAMKHIVAAFDWRPGDGLIVNNPFLGGTHLPDVTLISPLFIGEECIAFVANRAHHANIGADQPGSMPVSTHIEEEGIIIDPCFLFRDNALQSEAIATISKISAQPPADFEGWRSHPDLADFFAQSSANRHALGALGDYVRRLGVDGFAVRIEALNAYGTALSHKSLCQISNGTHSFSDQMDGTDARGRPLKICLQLEAKDGRLHFDFSGTSKQASNNLNCPLPVTAAAVFYVVRALLPAHAPSCDGLFSSVQITALEGSLLNARFPAAVAAGNVETSMRIVDVVLGALAPALPESVPAAAQGTMNNVAMGGRTDRGASRSWDYYETIAGGLGAHATGDGLSCAQAHMTNTLNTPIETLELHYPIRMQRYAIRRGSGGQGLWRGGDGVIRTYVFLESTEVSLLTERRRHAPWGLAGGMDGACGENWLNDEPLPSQKMFTAETGDCLSIHTPGGGGYGKPR